MGVAFALGIAGIALVFIIFLLITACIGMVFLIAGIVIKKINKNMGRTSKKYIACFVTSAIFLAPSVLFGGYKLIKDIEKELEHINVLSYQVKYNGINDVRRVLKNGISANSSGKELNSNYEVGNDYSILHMIAEDSSIKHKEKKIELLLDNGAEINKGNREGKTPLMYACINLNYDVVKCLLKNGADPNVKDLSGSTAFILMLIDPANDKDDEKKMIKIAELLIKNGANLTMTNENNKNVFTVSQDCGYGKMVELLEDNVDVIKGLMYNVMYKSADDVEKILKKGVKPDCKNVVTDKNEIAKEGEETALYYICSARDEVPELNDKIKLLIKYGADVEHRVGYIPDKTFGKGTVFKNGRQEQIEYGTTALMKAISMRNYETIKILVDAGADCSALDENADPPLMYIFDREVNDEDENKKIIELLLNKSKGVSKNGNYTFDIAQKARDKARSYIYNMIINSQYYDDTNAF